MKPRIFVSSTFYDLKYTREDLSNFIKAHDFEPIMFEDGDIGYIPGKPLDDSCYEAMSGADMVVLIIGGNYGSPATGEKDDFKGYMSVTRNEFQTAVNQGIPIFSFIDRKVYAEYGVYEVNLRAIEDGSVSINFNATKDINVFRFIKEIKTLGAISITEFDKSSDIKDFLSKQWADMFKNYLQSLKEKKQIGQLQSMMFNIQSLIEQMNVMIDGVGKKVISAEDFERVKEEQVAIKVKRICNEMSKVITIGYDSSISKITNKKELTSILVDCIIQEYKESIKAGNEYEPTYYNKLWGYLLDRNVEVRYSTFNLNNLTYESYDYLKNEDLRELTINALSEDVFFNQIFIEYKQDNSSGISQST